jgi:phage terminase small subunit
MDKLTDKQERFCREYVIDLNGTQAAIRAGYSENTANEQAAQLLAKLSIQSRIEELKAEIGKRLEITADMVVAELWALGVYNIKDFVKDDNTINKLSDMERDTLRPVVGIKVTEKTSTFITGDSETTITTDLKLADKRAALVDVGKHIGIFEKDNRQKVAPTNYDSLTDEDLIKLAEMQKKL